MQDQIDFFQATRSSHHRRSAAVPSRTKMRTISAGRLRPKHADYRTGTVGAASHPVAGAMLTLLRYPVHRPRMRANFLRPARDNRPLLRPHAGLRLIRRSSFERRPVRRAKSPLVCRRASRRLDRDQLRFAPGFLDRKLQTRCSRLIWSTTLAGSYGFARCGPS